MTTESQDDMPFLDFTKDFLSHWIRSPEGFPILFGSLAAALIFAIIWFIITLTSWINGDVSMRQVAEELAQTPRPMHELSRHYWVNHLRSAEGLRIMPATRGATLGCAIIPTYSMGNDRYDVPVALELSDLGDVRSATILADDPAFDNVCR